MVKNIKDSQYKLNSLGELFSPNGKRILPKNGIVNVTKNGKNTRRTLLSLMIETFQLENDTIQIEDNGYYGLDNLISISYLKDFYLTHV